MSRATRTAREVVLWLGATAGVLCLVLLLAGWLFNVTPLVFSSGSMSPTYDAGALGIARQVDVTDLAVGDVVSVFDASGDRVTHRVVDVARDGHAAVLTLQGDANDVSDAQAYRVEQVDRVAFGVPYAGYVLNAAASPFGLAVAAVVVVGLLLLGFGRGQRLVPIGLVATVVAGIGLGASGVTPWAFTSAYWTDTAKVTEAASTPRNIDTPSCTNDYPSTDKNGNQIMIAAMRFPDLGPGYTYSVEMWSLKASNHARDVLKGTQTYVGSSVGATIVITFPIIPGGGGNSDYDAVIKTLYNGSLVGAETVTPLHGGPGPGGSVWSAYCEYK